MLSGVPAWQDLAGLSAAQRDSLPDALVYGQPAIDTVPVAQRAPIQFPMRARGPGGAARTFTTCLGAAPSPRNQATKPPLAALRAITVPTLVVMGTDTLHLPGPLREQGAGVVATLPAAQRIVLPGTGHDPWLEQPDAFFAAVQRFLDERTARPARTPAS